jgi:pyruvate dehydrogenase E1 component beta subunit
VSLRPLDADAIAASVRKTGRLLIVDSAWTFCGASAELVTAVAERLQGQVAFTFERMGFAPTVCPTTKALERHYYPNAAKIAAAAFRLVNGDGASWEPEHIEVPEVIQFKGPF